MSIYHIDEDSKEDGITLVKLSGRAQAETIVKLLDELNALAELDSSLRVLIDETDLGAGFVGPSDIGQIAQVWADGRRAPLRPYRGIRVEPRHLRPQPHVSGSRGRSRAGERLQRPCAREGLAP